MMCQYQKQTTGIAILRGSTLGVMLWLLPCQCANKRVTLSRQLWCSSHFLTSEWLPCLWGGDQLYKSGDNIFLCEVSPVCFGFNKYFLQIVCPVLCDNCFPFSTVWCRIILLKCYYRRTIGPLMDKTGLSEPELHAHYDLK